MAFVIAGCAVLLLGSVGVLLWGRCRSRVPGQTTSLGRGEWLRLACPIFMLVGVAGLGFIAGYYLLDYTASPQFCGTSCHATQPEYNAHQRSAHALLDCSACHIASGLGHEFKAKLDGVEMLYQELSASYARPIAYPVGSLPETAETCERCHRRDAVYDDRVRELVHFGDDEFNMRSSSTMLMHSESVHWHVANPVEYVATDPARQSIPWVRAQIGERMLTFVDAEQPLSEAQLASYVVREMSCIDCHNRVAHEFRSTGELLDEALAAGRLPVDLPYFRQKAQAALDSAETETAAATALAALPEFYRTHYPEQYSWRAQALEEAVVILEDIYRSAHFPDMNLDADTYPDNLGHASTAGCFRCHDGAHYATSGVDQVIRPHCALCHSIPQPQSAGLTFIEEPLPSSHLASTWLDAHRAVSDDGCEACHQTSEACANPYCHGQTWTYLRLPSVEALSRNSKP